MQEFLHHKWEFGGVRVDFITKALRETKGVSQISRTNSDYKKSK
jgi:hypothetical protein